MSHLLLRLHVWCSSLLSGLDIDGAHGVDALPEAEHSIGAAPAIAPRRPIDVGQATTEYALVMLGAAVVALLVVSWATAGGGAGKIGRLFDRVIDAVAGKI